MRIKQMPNFSEEDIQWADTVISAGGGIGIGWSGSQTDRHAGYRKEFGEKDRESEGQRE